MKQKQGESEPLPPGDSCVPHCEGTGKLNPASVGTGQESLLGNYTDLLVPLSFNSGGEFVSLPTLRVRFNNTNP